jgi:hypothetical protein
LVGAAAALLSRMALRCSRGALVAADLVERAADRRYLRETAQSDLLLRLGYSTREGAAAALRANRLVLYAGRDGTDWLLGVRGRQPVSELRVTAMRLPD